MILSPGGNAIVPPIKGIENANTFIVKNVVDIAKLYHFLKENNVKKVSVLGGGFIGVEVAENLIEAGYEVSLVEAMPQICVHMIMIWCKFYIKKCWIKEYG